MNAHDHEQVSKHKAHEGYREPHTSQAVPSLQRQAGNTAIAELVRESIRGAGQPLEDGVRQEMEGYFGQPFADVRIHTGPTADRSAKALQANAYTVGSDIVFRQGADDVHSAEGRHHLVHELAHVMQQRKGPVSGSMVDGVRISDPADRHEQEAEEIASERDARRSDSNARARYALSGSEQSSVRRDISVQRQLNMAYSDMVFSLDGTELVSHFYETHAHYLRMYMRTAFLQIANHASESGRRAIDAIFAPYENELEEREFQHEISHAAKSAAISLIGLGDLGPLPVALGIVNQAAGLRVKQILKSDKKRLLEIRESMRREVSEALLNVFSNPHSAEYALAQSTTIQKLQRAYILMVMERGYPSQGARTMEGLTVVANTMLFGDHGSSQIVNSIQALLEDTYAPVVRLLVKGRPRTPPTMVPAGAREAIRERLREARDRR